MSGQKQEQTESKTEEQPSAISSEEADTIIERQMQVLRRLNDELLRTTRSQAVIGAGLVTLISLINPRLFLPESGNILWAGGFTITFLSFLAWYNHLGAARVSYTDLQLGVNGDVGENIPIEPPEADTPHERIRDFLTRATIHLPIVVSTFAGGSLTVSQFEEEIDRDEAHDLVASDAGQAIQYNNWILRTRERYVNAVRAYLTWTFVVMLMGVLLLVFY